MRALLGYEISGGDAFVASLVVASAVPGILLFSLYGGSLGDRFNKRFVTQICQLVGAVLSILLGVLFFAGLLTLPTLLGTLLIQGVFFAIQAPVRQSLIADLVPAGKLENAFSLNGLSIGLVNILAAAGGGVLYTSLGAGWAFVVVGAMLMGDAVLLTRLPAASGQPAAQTGMRDSTVHNISLGLRYIWRDTKLRLIMLHAVGALLLFMPARLLLPVFALEVYGSTAVEVGWLIGSLGVGGVIGSLLLARYVKNASLWIFAAVDLTIGAAMLLLAFVGSYSFILFGISALWGLGIAMFIPMQQSSISRQAGDRYRSRAMAVFFLAYGLVRLSLLPLGAAFEHVGAVWSILVLGSCLVIVGITVIGKAAGLIELKR